MILFEEKQGNHITSLLKIILCVVITPFLILSYFPTPSADDFCFATKVIENGFIQTQIELYHTIGGRFFSNAAVTSIISLMNYLGGKDFFIEKYWIVASTILIALWFAFFLFVKTLLSSRVTILKCGLKMSHLKSRKESYPSKQNGYSTRRLSDNMILENSDIENKGLTISELDEKLVLGQPPNYLSTKESFWAASGIFIIYVTRVPTTAQAFYWLPGSITYTFANIAALFLFSFLLNSKFTTFSRTKKDIHTLTCCLLSAAVIGDNETIMIILLIILFFGTLYTHYHKHPNTSLWKMTLLTSVASAILVFTAPGNNTRLSYFSQKLQIEYSIISSLKISIMSFFIWSRNITIIGASMILLSFSTKKCFKYVKLNKRYFVTFFIIWFGIIFLSFLPAFLAMGHKPPMRARNTIYLVYLLGWFYFVFMFGTIFFQSYIQKISKQLMTIGQIIMILGLLFTGNFLRSVKDLTLAPTYKLQVKERTRFIKQASINQSINPITVSPYKNIPKTITFDDIEKDTTNWKNKCCSNFYSIDSIRLIQ